MKDLLKRLNAVNEERKKGMHTMLLQTDLEKVIEIVGGQIEPLVSLRIPLISECAKCAHFQKTITNQLNRCSLVHKDIPDDIWYCGFPEFCPLPISSN